MEHATGRIRAVSNPARRGNGTSLLWAALALIALCAGGAAAQDATSTAPTFKTEEIDQLVAPIALYPDSLIAQILMASTYPLEVVEAARWSKENPDVKDKALEDAMQKQSWDPSVKSLTAFPQVLTMMNEDLAWTQKLGDAFLAQQSDVLDGVQRLRAKAKAEGNLETTKEQKVIVEQAPAPPANVEQNVNVEAAPAPETVIKIEPADPQVVYVPTYNPTTVYGAWPYPSYPPYYYYPPGYVAATSMISFGFGMAAGAALWGDCDWGGNDVDIDVNRYNEFNRTDIKNGNWEHNSDHRKGVGYRDNKTQQRYGKGQNQAAKSREQFRGRAESGRQDLKGAGGDKARRDVERANRQGAGNTKRDAQQRSGQQRAAQQRDSTASRDAARQRSTSERAGQQRAGTNQQRSSTANRDAARQQSANRQAQQRQSSQQRTRQASSDRNAGAYRGMDSGRNTRQYSDRGRSSRMGSSGGGFGGGGGRSGGFGGGGGRGGGGMGGGGRGGGGRR